MAELTLTEIRDATRFRGDYTNLRRFPDTSLNVEIQKGFDKFYEIVAQAHQGWWDTQTTVVTVASQAYAALPSACWIVRNIGILDGSDYRPLRQIGVDESYRFGSDTGMPSSYTLTSRGIDLFPTPDAVYTLRVHYTPRAPAIGTSARDYYNGWEDYVIEYVLSVLDEREKMPIEARLAKLDAIEKQVRSGAAERRAQEPEYLPLRELDVEINDDRWR